MNTAQLETFRTLAAQMSGPATQDWEWVGKWESQRMFGITEARAKGYAAKHGGAARQMA